MRNSSSAVRTLRTKVMVLENEWHIKRDEVNDELSDVTGRLEGLEAREIEMNTDIEAINKRMNQVREESLVEKNLLQNEIRKSNERFSLLEAMLESSVTALKTSNDHNTLLNIQLESLSKSTKAEIQSVNSDTTLLRDSMNSLISGTTTNHMNLNRPGPAHPPISIRSDPLPTILTSNLLTSNNQVLGHTHSGPSNPAPNLISNPGRGPQASTGHESRMMTFN